MHLQERSYRIAHTMFVFVLANFQVPSKRDVIVSYRPVLLIALGSMYRLYIYMSIYVNVHIYIYILYMCVYIYAHMSVRMTHAHISTYMYMYIYICVYIYMATWSCGPCGALSLFSEGSDLILVSALWVLLHIHWGFKQPKVDPAYMLQAPCNVGIIYIRATQGYGTSQECLMLRFRSLWACCHLLTSIGPYWHHLQS